MTYNTVSNRWSYRIDGLALYADTEKELREKIHTFRMTCNVVYRNAFNNNSKVPLTTGRPV